MDLEHSFTVPVPEDRAWEVLLDVERVAPCMPGATLQSIDGDVIHGTIKVKVGPISMTYQGTARFTERDPAGHVITLEASGKDTRGAGTASAKVRSMLEGKGDETHVVVHTTLNVTGKPAQFGRGVMTEVGGRLIGIFAGNLAQMLAADNSAGAAETGGEAPAVTAEAVASETGATTGGGSQQASAGAAGPAATATQDEALPIDVLNLGTRAWSSLRQAGIQTLGDLIKRTPQQLLAIDNIGPASIADIRRKLADRGLTLAESAAGANGASARVAETATAGQPGDAEQPAALPAARATAAEANGAQAGAPEEEEVAPAPVTPLRPRQSDTPEWHAQDDAIDLLSVAGLPVLKRAVPAVAGVLALILVVVGVRRRRARRR
jgi:carbon monoxide dehydrogenase subunit G